MNFSFVTKNLPAMVIIFVLVFGLIMVGCSKKENGVKTGENEKKPYEAQASLQKLLSPDMDELSQPAPEKFKIRFETSKGNFIVEVQRAWSPFGVDRLYYLVNNHFYDNVRFFRVIDGFMAQFGFHGDVEISKIWSAMTFPDDPLIQTNKRGFVSFAKNNLPDSRSTNLFINYVDNSRLDSYGFSPLGRVIEGMEVVDQLYNGYGEGAPGGRGPSPGRIHAEGNAYLNKEFPKLDYIKTARVIAE